MPANTKLALAQLGTSMNSPSVKFGWTTPGEIQPANVRQKTLNLSNQQLLQEVQACTLCERMSCSRRVLSDLNGDWTADVVFVAEAPGRLGAEKTGIPLFGDRTGDRFDELLREMGLNRNRIFITNAILCNPRDGNGNNDSPKSSEIRNCTQFLKRTIESVDPKVIVALGRIALEALNLIHAHDLTLRNDVGKIKEWGGRRLVALYHPAPRTVVHRSWRDQVNDARKVANHLRRVTHQVSAV
jgi:uracil-DNA glycosylase family 4